MTHSDENIGIIITYSCLALVAIAVFLRILFIIWVPKEKTKEDPAILKQILEDIYWDEWIEAEAHRINLIFEEKKTITYEITLPKDYFIYHESGKYRTKKIVDCVANRYQDLKDGAGRNLILS